VCIAWPTVFAGVKRGPDRIPKGFVHLSDVEPTIKEDIRYNSSYNFIGEKIRGYQSARCILTSKAAQALARAQRELAVFGMSLKVYDCYRPREAVEHFLSWGKNLADQRMKADYYPTVPKENLFRDGYISTRSAHSRGSTVDLTLIGLPAASQPDLPDDKPGPPCHASDHNRFADNSLDMGTAFDCFHPRSHTEDQSIGSEAKRNRLLLRTILDKVGFTNYRKEWWHFTLRDEPYPKTYFDFPVQ
jgi:D-alanyl-D-alanine dipeptidase